MDINEEKRLVMNAKKDVQVFSALYDANNKKILNYVISRIGNAEIAQDITSEVFIRAMKNLWRYKWMGIRFSSWLYRIANNCIMQHYRKNSKIMPVSLDVMIEEQGFMPRDPQDLLKEIIEKQDELERNVIYKRLHKIILELPIIYQEVIVLKYFHDKKISEISEITGKKEGTIKSLLSRGRNIIEEKLRHEKKTKTQPFQTLSIINNIK